VGVDGKLVGATKNFVLNPSQPRDVPGARMPTKLDVRVKTGGYEVTGTVTELRFQDSIDVLGSVSLPVRLAIKALYTNPYLMRYAGHYEFDVTDKDDATEHIAGECLVEVDTY